MISFPFLLSLLLILSVPILLSYAQSMTPLEKVLGERMTEHPNDTVCREEVKQVVQDVYENVEKLSQPLTNFESVVQARKEKKIDQGSGFNVLKGLRIFFIEINFVSQSLWSYKEI